MLKSPHAVKLVGTLFIAFSFFVVYSTFTSNSLFSITDQRAQLVSSVSSPTGYLQVFVMAGASPLSPMNPPTTANSYLDWIASNTFNPPLSKQPSFRVARANFITAHFGLDKGILFDQSTTTGSITVWVPKVDGYEVRGYIYNSAFANTNEDKTVHQPISAFTINATRITGSNLTDHYFNFPLLDGKLTRLIIFYERLPVACRNITVDLIETKQPTGRISFSLSGVATPTAHDLSYLRNSPYSVNSALVPDYVLETRRSFTVVTGAFNLDSHRFTIIDDFSGATSSLNTVGPVKEDDSAIISVVVPFDQALQFLFIRENKVGGLTSPIPVGPFPATCPASCKLEFETPDFGSRSGRCCAGMTVVENEGGLVCVKT